MRPRVVVTGVGCVTPVGHSVDAMWTSLQEMRSGVGPITHFDASEFPTHFAAEVKDFELADYVDDVARYEHSGRNVRFAIAAAHQAVADSGLTEYDVEPTRCGVYLGAGEGQQDFGLFMGMLGDSFDGDDVDYASFARLGLGRMHPIHEREQEPNTAGLHLAGLFNAQGPNLNCLTACAASSQALGEATELIRRGDVDVMISGGAHSMIHPFGVTGFNLLTALSTYNEAPQRASRPFDKNLDGVVLAEGAGMLILEVLTHANPRGEHS